MSAVGDAPDGGGGIGRPHTFVLFAFLALAAAAGTAIFLVREAGIVASRTIEQLTAIADLKVQQVEAWLWERRGDAAVAARAALSPAPGGGLALAPVSPEVRRHLDVTRETYGYRDILLFDRDGRCVLSVAGEPPDTGDDLAALVAATLDARALRLSPVRRRVAAGDADVGFDIAAPVFAGTADGAGQPGGGAPAIGAVVTRVLPRRFLDPILRTWPAESASGEVVLASAGGGEGVYIVPPKKTFGATMSVGRPVAGTSWLLTTQINRAEAYAPFRRVAAVAALMVTALLVLSWLGLRQWLRRLADRVSVEGDRRFREMFLHAQLAYMVTGRDGTLQLANPAAAEMLGYDRVEDLIGRTTGGELFASPQDRDAMWNTLREKGRITGYRSTLRRRDGREIIVEGYLRLLRGPDGRISGTEGLVHDITERTRYQEALEREQQALIDARESAVEAARLKSEFVANISHEIRTPVNAVVGLTHLLLRTPLSDKQRDFLERIQSSARALQDVIDDVLDFSKIEAGRLLLERTPFVLDDVLRTVTDLLSLRAEEKGIGLRFVTEPGVPQGLVGDPTRLGQVLLNLAGNGVKFTERGEVVVRTGAQPASEDGTVVLSFAVSDTGIGMSADQLGKLFRPFTQADGSTTRQYGGTGLGLVISQRLIQQMNGEITVDSAIGRGSTFSFTARLALARPHHPPAPAPALAPASAPARGRALAGMHALLVEDIEINQLVARELLQAAGAQVTVAENGQAATELFAAQGGRFAFVLMDVQMPGMDGYEATRIIRRHPAGATVPIIAMTAHAFESERARCLAAGMTDHVAKPIEPDTVVALIARLVSRPAGVRAAEDPAPAPPTVALPSIDLAEAQHRLGGDDNLLLGLLRGFARDFGGAADEIRTSLARGDVAGARRRAHTLRGTGGNLSLRAVRAAAQVVEEALSRDPDGDHEAALSALGAALAAAAASIAALGGAPPTPPPALGALSDESLSSLIVELDDLLRRRSLNAAGCFDRVRQVCRGTAVEDDLAPLGLHIQGLDYETSRRNLRELARKAGVALPATPQ